MSVDPTRDVDITIPASVLADAVSSLPPALKPWLPIIVAGLVAVGAWLGVTVKNVVTPAPPTHPPVVVNVGPDSPVVAPSPVVPATTKVGLYLTDGAAVRAAQADAALARLGVAVDPKVHGAGATVNGTALPCATREVNGRVVDVVAYTTPAALESWLKK